MGRLPPFGRAGAKTTRQPPTRLYLCRRSERETDLAHLRVVRGSGSPGPSRAAGNPAVRVRRIGFADGIPAPRREAPRNVPKDAENTAGDVGGAFALHTSALAGLSGHHRQGTQPHDEREPSALVAAARHDDVDYTADVAITPAVGSSASSPASSPLTDPQEPVGAPTSERPFEKEKCGCRN